MLGLVVAIATVGLAAGPSTASAIEPPPGGTGWVPLYTPTRANPVYRYYEDGKYAGKLMEYTPFQRMLDRAGIGIQSLGTGKGTGYSTNASSAGPPIAAELKTVATTAGTVATVRQLKGESLSMMARLKSFGVLRAIGDVALAATAFEVGYSVGGKIADIFWPEETTHYETYTYKAQGLEPVEVGNEYLGAKGSNKVAQETVLQVIYTKGGAPGGGRFLLWIMNL